MEKLYDQYNMSFDMAREIIYYGRKVNNDLLIYCFLDGVADYVHRNGGKTKEGTTDLLHAFHKKFVETFGKE